MSTDDIKLKSSALRQFGQDIINACNALDAANASDVKKKKGGK